jgi:hypothetical protein
MTSIRQYRMILKTTKTKPLEDILGEFDLNDSKYRQNKQAVFGDR